MPWVCAPCQLELNDDAGRCPECGAEKTAWTVVVDRTRTLRVGGAARVELLRGRGQRPLPCGAPLEVDLVPATEARVLPRAYALELAGRGQAPGGRDVLTLRLHARGGKDPSVTLGVERQAGEREELRIAQAPLRDEEQGVRDLRLVFVHGGPRGGPAEVELPGVAAVIDLSDDSPAGFAPAIEVAALRKGPFELPTAAAAPPRAEVLLLEMEDLCFHTDSAVLLPAGTRSEGSAAQEAAAGLAALRTVLRYVAAYPRKELLITGHADASGSAAHNLELSRLRAENVALYLRGERAAWVASCEARHRPEDAQQVLAFLARARGLPCDPGPVDGDWGPRSQAALAAFRQAVAAEAGGPPAGEPAPGPGPADWGAFYDCYERELARLLGCAPGELSAWRARLSFVAPGFVGCGERWPASGVRLEGHRSQQDRRVELLFFDPDERPALACHAGGGCDPGRCDLFQGGRYRAGYLPEDIDAFVPADAQDLLLAWPAALGEGLPSDLLLELRAGGEARSVAFADGALAGDERCFRFRGLPRGAPLTLSARAPSRGLEVALLEGQVLGDPATPARLARGLGHLPRTTTPPAGEVEPLSGLLPREQVHRAAGDPLGDLA